MHCLFHILHLDSLSFISVSVQLISSDGDADTSHDTQLSMEYMGHCDGEHCEKCEGLQRVITALDKHQKFLDSRNDDNTAFLAFLDKHYPSNVLLNDYIHFVEHHADQNSIEFIRSRLQRGCESAVDCGATARHYRDRRDEKTNGNMIESNDLMDRIDSIHFMVHHLHELGLRVSVKMPGSVVDEDDEKYSKSELKTLALKEMSDEVDAKKAHFTTERLDGVANSKFTLQINKKKSGGAAKGVHGMWSLKV